MHTACTEGYLIVFSKNKGQSSVKKNEKKGLSWHGI
jgi:hypothetical protein